MDNKEKKIDIIKNHDCLSFQQARIKLEPEKEKKNAYMINDSDPELAVKSLMKKMIADKVM